MLLMNKTLLKLARGLWLWILAIAGVGFLTLVGTTALAEIIAGFLGTLFQPQEILHTAWGAVSAALAAAVFTFLAQLLKGLLEYRTAAKAREGMRKMIFSKVLELDAGGIEKIGPVSAITASVDAVEQMQTYFSTYLPSLIYSIIAPVYLFFHLKGISMPVAVLLLVVSLFLLPINNAFRSRIEDIRKIYWRSLDDMTGYYMDSLRGLTTLKLFDRDREHSRILGEKADILNKNISNIDEEASKYINPEKEVNSVEDAIKGANDIIAEIVSDDAKIRKYIREFNDINIIKEKDFVTHPKESGYTSYHMVVQVPVEINKKINLIKVEIQIRSLAMDFWASLEHKIKYKPNGEINDDVSKELVKCARNINKLDNKMIKLFKK